MSFRFDTNDKEVKYKILVYPNITFQQDLEKDSYVVVLGNIIKEMKAKRSSLNGHHMGRKPGHQLEDRSV